MALFTLGGGYGAVIKDGRQDGQGESQQGKSGERAQERQDITKWQPIVNSLNLKIE